MRGNDNIRTRPSVRSCSSNLHKFKGSSGLGGNFRGAENCKEIWSLAVYGVMKDGQRNGRGKRGFCVKQQADERPHLWRGVDETGGRECDSLSSLAGLSERAVNRG